jgi:hypothetical protein
MNTFASAFGDCAITPTFVDERCPTLFTEDVLEYLEESSLGEGM